MRTGVSRKCWMMGTIGWVITTVVVPCAKQKTSFNETTWRSKTFFLLQFPPVLPCWVSYGIFSNKSQSWRSIREKYRLFFDGYNCIYSLQSLVNAIKMTVICFNESLVCWVKTAAENTLKYFSYISQKTETASNSFVCSFFPKAIF